MDNAEIQNIGNCRLGTIEVEIKAKGQRGFQEFVFYPADKNSNRFVIQSDKRYGFYYPADGAIRLSKSRSGGSYAHSYLFDQIHKNTVVAHLSEADRVKLNQAIAGSNGANGDKVIKIDNSYAETNVFGA